MALILKHQTPEAFISRVRQAYRDGNSEQIIKIARFLIGRIQAGDITDAQVRSAFGLTAVQWTTLKTKMQSFITADNTIKSAVGQ